jgi:uncharacterized membrane protein
MLRALVFLALLIAMQNLANAAAPGYFKVTGVAPGDVLNIRLEPGADSQQIGSFEPGTDRIEVLEVVTTRGSEWGRVHASDTDGWVSMRFLEPVEVKLVGNTNLPEGLRCGGTEPFWSADLSEGSIDFSPMEGAARKLPLAFSVTAIGRNNRFALAASDGARRMTLVVGEDGQCSDGMSDRQFRWRADLLMENPADSELPTAYEGCCSLPV